MPACAAAAAAVAFDTTSTLAVDTACRALVTASRLRFMKLSVRGVAEPPAPEASCSSIEPAIVPAFVADQALAAATRSASDSLPGEVGDTVGQLTPPHVDG